MPLPSSSDNNSNTIQRKLDSYNIDTIRPEDNDEDDASSSFPESIDPEIDIPIKFVDYEQVVGKIQRFIPFQGTPSSPKDNQDQQTPNRKQKRNAVESDVLMHKKFQTRSSLKSLERKLTRRVTIWKEVTNQKIKPMAFLTLSQCVHQGFIVICLS